MNTGFAVFLVVGIAACVIAFGYYLDERDIRAAHREHDTAGDCDCDRGGWSSAEVSTRPVHRNIPLTRPALVPSADQLGPYLVALAAAVVVLTIWVS